VRASRRAVIVASAVLAGAVAASGVLLVLDLRSQGTPTATALPTPSASQLVSPPPLGTTPLPLPVPSPTATVAIPLPDISSTITATAPLAVYPSWTTPGQLIARNYQGTVVGTFSMNPDFMGYYGYLVSPDGSKVLLGNGMLMGIDGFQLGDIPTAEIPSPVWGDDSNLLCGIDGSGDLLEVTKAGAVVSSTPLGTSNAVVAGCSPDADRAVVLTAGPGGGPLISALVIQLSTGTVLAAHATTNAGVASHDCQLFASDGAKGVTIRNVATWAVVGQVDRTAEGMGGTATAAAYAFSWDENLLVLQAGGATPPFTAFVVSLANGATLFQSGAVGDLGEINQLGSSEARVIPLLGTSEFLLSEHTGAYLLGSDGQISALPG